MIIEKIYNNIRKFEIIYNIEIYPDDKMIIIYPGGQRDIIIPRIDEEIIVWEGNREICRIGRKMEDLTDEEWYLFYNRETNQPATYRKGKVQVEYKQFKEWKEKKLKGKENGKIN